MKLKVLTPLLFGLSLVAGTALGAPASVGQPAPAFSLSDAAGKTVSLADFRGRTVVLEWVNPECPYVRKHYNSANMQATQKGATVLGQHHIQYRVGKVAGTHEFVSHPNYVIVYRRTLIAIEILNVVHSRQQYPR